MCVHEVRLHRCVVGCTAAARDPRTNACILYMARVGCAVHMLLCGVREMFISGGCVGHHSIQHRRRLAGMLRWAVLSLVWV